MYIYIYMYIYIHIYMYIHMYIYTYRSIESRHTYEWFISHIWLTWITHLNVHVNHINKHRHIWMSHIWMSHITHMNQSITHMNQSYHTYEWAMSQVMMHHATPVPLTEEIGLKIITTAKISNEFSRESPYISNSHVASNDASCHTY